MILIYVFLNWISAGQMAVWVAVKRTWMCNYCIFMCFFPFKYSRRAKLTCGHFFLKLKYLLTAMANVCCTICVTNIYKPTSLIFTEFNHKNSEWIKTITIKLEISFKFKVDHHTGWTAKMDHTHVLYACPSVVLLQLTLSSDPHNISSTSSKPTAMSRDVGM